MVPRILKLSKTNAAIIALLALVLIGYVDYVTGSKLSLSTFYLLPISLVALNFSKSVGIGIAVLSAIVETTVHMSWGVFHYSSMLIHFWNMGILMSIYIIIAVLVSSLGHAYARERESARKDFMTGIANWQAFVEAGEREVARAKRFQGILSIAYIDCDNFKMVNDTLGHSTGDMVLRKVAAILQRNTRQTDIFARVGGDEFAVLFTNAGVKGSETAVREIRRLLLEEMEKNRWEVTFSIGMVTFVEPPRSVETMIEMADMLMYDVKKTTQNAIKHEVIAE